MARGRGGFRNIPSGGRRRSRSPPHHNDNNNNSNNNNSQQQQQQNTKPPNQAASTSTFELRRLVTQAFLKFASTELSGLEKDKVMPDIFKASDSAAFYNPVNNETRQTALDRFKSSLQDILKSNDVVEWMMEKASHLVDPQPREQRLPVPAAARQFQQQQQQQQQQAPPPYGGGGNNNNGIMAFGGGRFNHNNNNNNAGGVPGAMMMNPNNNNNMNRFGNSNMMMPNNNNTRSQQPPLALLPDPADPKVLLIKDLPEELNEEQNIRITINNRANNNVLKAVVCEPEKNRAICFCFDESQALLLRSYPSGTVFIRAPDAKLVECDATTWKHALIRLRNRVLEQEELAMQEINKLTSEEEGISIEEVKKNQKPMGLAKIAKSTTTKTDDADSSSQQQQQQQQQQAPPQKTPQEEAAIKEVAQLEKQQQDFKQDLEKYEKELSLLESLGDSISMIPGQEERKKVVEGEVAKRKKQLEECGAALDKARQTLDSFDETKKKNKQQQEEQGSSNNNTDSSSSQQQQDNNNNNTQEQGEAASQEYNAENKREKKFSSSSAAIENPRALLFFSGFPEAWSDNKILALLKYLPQATPLHVWRAPNSTMVCVELQGGASAAANIATFLSYNDFIYCDVRVTRQRPQQ